MKTDITVCGLVFNQEKEVLLGYNKKYEMWLGFGGHLHENDIPDERLIQKIKQEAGLEVVILDPVKRNIPVLNNTIRNCGTPFHADLHGVSDHLHYAQYYICQLKDNSTDLVKISDNEKNITKYRRFKLPDLEKDTEIAESTKEILKLAYSLFDL